MAHSQVVSPHRLRLTLQVIAPQVFFFKDPIKGKPLVPRENYTLIDPPERIPGSSISVQQDWYLTTDPTIFKIPLFLNLKELFLSEFDSYHTVTEVDRLRPDLISHNFYASVDLFWVILLANDVLDPFNIPVNKILRIPSPHTVLSKWLVRPLKRLRRG